MATGFVNRVIFNASSTGTGSFVVASAVTGYLTPAQASATDQKSYRYAAQLVDGSGNITDWEIGTGVYTVSSVTLTRTVLKSSNSDSAVAFTSIPQVMLTAFAGDLTLLYSTTQVDKGTATATVTFDVSASSKQKLTVGGACTAAFTGWPTTGSYGEIEIQLVNAGTSMNWPTINWLKGDGSSTTTFASAGVTFQATGTNFVIIWSADGGTSLYGRAG